MESYEAVVEIGEGEEVESGLKGKKRYKSREKVHFGLTVFSLTKTDISPCFFIKNKKKTSIYTSNILE